MLRQGGHRVLDVALDFVFDSHEGFTRSFARGFGISPKKFAARPRPEGWQIPIRYLKRSEKTGEVPGVHATISDRGPSSLPPEIIRFPD